VFAYQFIRKLEKNRKPYLTPREIYADIGPIVRNNSEQMPLCRPIKMTGDQGGEFVFVASTSTMSVRSSTKPSVATPLEEEKKRMAEERALLHAERQRLAEEKQRLEMERKLTEERQQLAKEKAQQEADRKRLEEERERLAQAEAVKKEETKRKKERKGIQKGERGSGAVQLKPEKENKRLASIPQAMKEKPYERKKKDRVPFESEPGLYVNQDLGFYVRYPESWVIIETKYRNEVYAAKGESGTRAPVPNVRVFIAEKPKRISLEDYPEIHMQEMREQIPSLGYYQIENKKVITLEDGVHTVECEVKWVSADGRRRFLSSYLAVYRNDKCISISSSDSMPLLFKKSVTEKLKAVTRSLKFY
jgi:hypothetical protein